METLMSRNDRILVIQTAFPGDAILTIPMLQKLKEKNTGSQIDVLAIPSTEEIFSASEYVDRVIIIDKKKKHKGIRGLNKFIKTLKKNSYTKIYSPHRSFRSAYITVKLGVKESYGFDNSSLKYAYNHTIKYEPLRHEVQRNLALVGEIVEDNRWKILPEVRTDEEVKNRINNLLLSNKIEDNFITLAPGSVWETKRYPKENYIELIKLLVGRNENVILIGGNEDQQLCDEIVFGFGDNVKNFSGELSITDTIFLLKKTRILITNDSAPTHMGMCADIPVLTIYCSTVPEFGFYPYNTKSRFLSYDELKCKPCGIHGYRQCPVKTFECGNKLSPEDVFREVRKIVYGNAE